MKDSKKLLGLIGICQRAGRLKTGAFAVEKSIKDGRSRLCLIAEDASEASKKKYKDMCVYRDIPVIVCGLDREKLGHTAGKELRSAVSVEDAGLASSIMDVIEGGNANE